VIADVAEGAMIVRLRLARRSKMTIHLPTTVFAKAFFRQTGLQFPDMFQFFDSFQQ
jgi:hypothetical protein